MNAPTQVVEVLSKARRPLVLGHVNPDIDALGAILGLARAISASSAVAIDLPDAPTNARTRFMLELGGNLVVADTDRVAAADVVIVVDTASTRRVNVTGGWEAIAEKHIVNIDHHLTNTDFGQLNWVADGVSSTCEMIYRLLRTAGWPLDAHTASLLLAGVYADTGGFSLPNATAETFDAAAALVRAGADVGQVGSRLCRSQSPHEFDLVRTVYRNTRLTDDGLIAYSTLSHAEITAAGCTPHDIDDQVSIPRSLAGIKMAIMFSEGQPGVIRINLRGEYGTPVLPLAQQLGGGGHTCSAGVRVRGELSAVVQRVLGQAAEMLSWSPGPMNRC